MRSRWAGASWLLPGLLLLRLSRHAQAGRSNATGEYEGDLLLAGLFPLHGRGTGEECNTERIEWDGLFQLEAFYLTLDLLNANLSRDHGFTLGAVTQDTCYNERVALIKSLKFVMKRLVSSEAVGEPAWTNSVVAQSRDIVGVVGPMSSDVAMQVANLLGMFHIPQISYAATSPVLSNAERFPYFLRTVPSDIQQVNGIVEILVQRNWTYVAAIYEDSSYGMRGFQKLKAKARNASVCFVSTLVIDVDSSKKPNFTASLLKLRRDSPKARVVILYVTLVWAKRILAAADAVPELRGHFVWLGTDGWGSRYLPPNLNRTIQGAIVSHPVQREFPGFREHFFHLDPRRGDLRNPWLRQAFEDLHRCRLEPKGGETRCPDAALQDPFSQTVEGTEFGYMHFVRDAVLAFGKALGRMHARHCGPERGVCRELRTALRLGLESQDSLIRELQRTRFPSGDGRKFSFVRGRDGAAAYSVMAYRCPPGVHCRWTELGQYSKRFNLTVDWSRSGQNYPVSRCSEPCPAGQVERYNSKSNKCCWVCEPCLYPLYRRNRSVCANCSQELSFGPDGRRQFWRPNVFGNACVVVPLRRVGFEDTAVMAVLSSAAVGLLVTGLTSLAFLAYSHTPIIKAAGRELSWVLLVGISLCYLTTFLVAFRPGPLLCSAVRFLYSLSYTVSYAAIFVKINRIARIFHVTKAGAPNKRTRYTSPVSQLLLVAAIIGFQAALNAVWLVVKGPEADQAVERDWSARDVVAYEFCEAFEDFDMLIALLVPLLLILLSAVYGFKARKCPGKFNETRYIILTTYTTCVVWLAFIPVFFTTHSIPLRIFALSASLALNATVTLVCLFAPKLYVALCRPHKNTKEAVMGRKGPNNDLTSFSNKHAALDTSSPEPTDLTSPTQSAKQRSKPRYKHSYAGYPLNSDSNRRESSSRRRASSQQRRAKAGEPVDVLPEESTEMVGRVAPLADSSETEDEGLAETQPHQLSQEEDEPPLAHGEDSL